MRALSFLKFMGLLGILVLFVSCTEGHARNVMRLKMEEFTTHKGLQCVSLRGNGISCNWEKYNETHVSNES